MHDRISSGIFRELRRVPVAAIARSIVGALVTLFILTQFANAKPPAEGLEPLSRAVVAEGFRQEEPPEGTPPGGPPEGAPPGGRPPWKPEPGTVQFTIDTVVTHQFESDVDGGGNVEVDRFAARTGIRYVVSDELATSFSLTYEHDAYDFLGGSGGSGLAERDPWEGIHSLRGGFSFRWTPEEDVTVFGTPFVGFSAESGADIEDAILGGVITGASFEVSENLSIGPGFGLVSQIEDSLRGFPIVVLDWRITEDLALRTARGITSLSGPGLVLGWDVAKSYELEFGARYENRRFRLDDRRRAPDGVGEDESFPIFATLHGKPMRNLTFSVSAGVAFGGRLTLEDKSGDRIDSEDYDPAPFASLAVSIQF